MNRYILWVCVAIFPTLVFADAKTMKVLDKAYMYALDKHYKEAISKALPLLDSLTLNKIEEIVLAHQILSLSYCEIGNKEKAQEHLKALRAFSPNEDFRAFNPSQDCQIVLAAPAAQESPKTKKRK